MPDAMWNRIDQLSLQQQDLDKKVALVEQEQKRQREAIRENHRDMMTLLVKLNEKTDRLTEEMHQARGGLQFGKWLGGIAVTLLAVGVSILAYMKGAS